MSDGVLWLSGEPPLTRKKFVIGSLIVSLLDGLVPGYSDPKRASGSWTKKSGH